MNAQRFPFEDFSSQPGGEVIKPALPKPLLQAGMLPLKEMTEPPPPPPAAPVYSAEDVERARQEGFARGKAEGYALGKQEGQAELDAMAEGQAQLLTALLESLHHKLNIFFASVENEAQVPKPEILVHLSLEIARKIAGDALQVNAAGEISTFIRRAMEMLFDEPRLTVYVPASLHGPLVQRMDALKTEQNFHGTLAVRPEAALEPTDCRIEWNNGYLHHKKDAIWEEIRKILDVVSENNKVEISL